jgi:hypothetical protein
MNAFTSQYLLTDLKPHQILEGGLDGSNQGSGIGLLAPAILLNIPAHNTTKTRILKLIVPIFIYLQHHANTVKASAFSAMSGSSSFPVRLNFTTVISP